jgi:hypothetical protein
MVADEIGSRHAHFVKVELHGRRGSEPQLVFLATDAEPGEIGRDDEGPDAAGALVVVRRVGARERQDGAGLAPLVTQALVPVRIQSFPSRRARVVSAAASEPASGSDNAKAPSVSPRAMGGRKRARCSSEPCRKIICVGSELWTLIRTAADASTAAISSSATR